MEYKMVRKTKVRNALKNSNSKKPIWLIFDLCEHTHMHKRKDSSIHFYQLWIGIYSYYSETEYDRSYPIPTVSL